MSNTHAERNHTNALIHETSPYLVQHAHNPVDWHPWGEAALARARREDKPLLLSIGYSACHWCHVMAHESFEDEDTARVMNELFVNVKVDREERPDLDKIYQTAHTLLAQRSGGWPLTMFLTPDDHTPFFGGTYFPREARHGLPAFTDLLRRVSALYREHREEIKRQSTSLVEAMRSEYRRLRGSAVRLDAAPLQAARRQLEQSFDPAYGGFGGAPKFPHPTNLEGLLRHYAASRLGGQADAQSLEMACYTLRAMAQGGVYDQLGGGFYRYSVDEKWMIPHFEKMLYDNGPLLTLYSDAWALTAEPLFRRVAEQTGEWVMREMQSPEGGYYSTLDADSEGEEGKFYLWTRDEVRQVLDDEEYTLVAQQFGLDRGANFEGRWHLHAHVDIATLARELNLDTEQARALVDSGRAKLFQEREARVRPGRDEKILTAWNALMIKGMATAGRRLGRLDFIASAERALEFIRRVLLRDGRLLATYKDGRAHLNAYLDDYVLLSEALLELLQVRWNGEDLVLAVSLCRTVVDHFQDAEGGFFFTSDDHEALFHRPKPLADDSLPAGNGIAAQVAGRFGHLLGDAQLLEAAERTLKAAWVAIGQMPFAHQALLRALEEYLDPPQTIVLRGEPPAVESWHARCLQYYAPRRVVLAIPVGETELPGNLANLDSRGRVVAYVCNAHACSPPIGNLRALEAELARTEIPGTGTAGGNES